MVVNAGIVSAVRGALANIPIIYDASHPNRKKSRNAGI